MIIIKLTGGLGNQLFQYAIGRKLSIKNNDSLFFDVSFYTYVKNRNFILDKFHTVGKPLSLFDAPLFFPSTLPIIGSQYETMYHHLLGGKFSHVVEKKYYSFDNTIFSTKGNIYLDGYWQHRSYFSDILPTLLRDLKCKFSFSPELQKLKKQMEKTTSVSVHARRGDYTKLQGFGTCSIDYYKKAVKKIESIVSVPHYFVFSDDISWAKENLGFIPRVHFVEDLHGELEDLTAIAACTHHIIANSTFSWWGSVISKSKKGVTIAPTPWVNYEHSETVGLYFDDWIVLPRD